MNRKKSEVLEALGSKVVKYYMVEKYLHVVVTEVNWSQLDYIVDSLLAIRPIDGRCIEITFDSNLIID